MFVVYHTYRNRTYNGKDCNKIDCDFDLEKAKEEWKKKRFDDVFEFDDDDDISLVDFDKFIKLNEEYQHFQRSDLDNDSFAQREDLSNLEESINSEDDLESINGKRGFAFQEDDIEYGSPRRLTKVKFDI